MGAIHIDNTIKLGNYDIANKVNDQFLAVTNVEKSVENIYILDNPEDLPNNHQLYGYGVRTANDNDYQEGKCQLDNLSIMCEINRHLKDVITGGKRGEYYGYTFDPDKDWETEKSNYVKHYKSTVLMMKNHVFQPGDSGGPIFIPLGLGKIALIGTIAESTDPESPKFIPIGPLLSEYNKAQPTKATKIPYKKVHYNPDGTVTFNDVLGAFEESDYDEIYGSAEEYTSPYVKSISGDGLVAGLGAAATGLCLWSGGLIILVIICLILIFYTSYEILCVYDGLNDKKQILRPSQNKKNM
jgi:hypothetical protein